MPQKTNRRPKAQSATKRPNYKNPDANTRRLTYIGGAVIFCIVAWLVASAKQTQPDTVEINGIDLLNVATNNPELPEQVIHYKGMTVSFNKQTHQPNWVAWELLESETTGLHARDNQFAVDPQADGCATTNDYKQSGYDRGHMAPAGDMKWDCQAMRESFYMTNICPQAGELNRGPWQKLEEKCRYHAQTDSAVYIVCGPIFQKGRAVEHIGNTHVAVPHEFFKVIISPYADPPTGIGFIFPNPHVEGGMQKCAVSIDSIETVTGYDFFAALPDSVDNILEAQCNFNRWSQTKRKSSKHHKNPSHF